VITTDAAPKIKRPETTAAPEARAQCIEKDFGTKMLESAGFVGLAEGVVNSELMFGLAANNKGEFKLLYYLVKNGKNYVCIMSSGTDLYFRSLHIFR
jgi:hypothetical protein